MCKGQECQCRSRLSCGCLHSQLHNEPDAVVRASGPLPTRRNAILVYGVDSCKQSLGNFASIPVLLWDLGHDVGISSGCSVHLLLEDPGIVASVHDYPSASTSVPSALERAGCRSAVPASSAILLHGPLSSAILSRLIDPGSRYTISKVRIEISINEQADNIIGPSEP